MRILMDHSPTGFGPRGKATILAKALRNRCHEVGFTPVPVADLPMEEVEKILESGQPLQWDLCFAVMSPGLAAFARKKRKPLAYLDSLFYMWDSIDETVLSADLYFAQNFPGVPEKINAWGKKINHPVIVGPIVPPDDTLINSSKHVLITLGGDHSLIPSGYASSIASFAHESLHPQPLVFCGDGWRDYPPDEYHTLVKQATCVIASPGLTGAFEAFACKKPVYFLPPQNFSQDQHYKVFQNYFGGRLTIDLVPFGITLLPPELDEEVGRARIKERNTSSPERIIKAAREVILKCSKTLSEKPEELEEIAQEGYKLFTRLGGNGIYSVIAHVEALYHASRK